MEEDTTTDRACTLSADELVSLCLVIWYNVMMGQGQGLNVVLFNLLIVIID
jgi:hypothetical protein